MRIIVTGSLGNISKPLTEKLVQKGHSVTVISSNEDRRASIESIGAKAAIGSMEDVDFLTATFTGADALYLMEAHGQSAFFDYKINVIKLVADIANAYKQAVDASGVKKVIHLSSIGAHHDKDNGVLIYHYNAEQSLQKLPDDVKIKTMRPVGFYTNMLGFIQAIKSYGTISSNFGGDKKRPLGFAA